MAAPVGNVNTVGAGSVEEPNEKIPVGSLGVHSLKCRRTVQHFIDNNNASSAPTARAVASGVAGDIIYSQGYYHVPWTFVGSSTTFVEQQILKTSKRYRLNAAGFKIIKAQAIIQKASVNAGTVSISNSFVQAPYLVMFKDSQHELFENTYLQTLVGPAPYLPIWQTTIPNSALGNYQTSYAAGALNLVGFCQSGGQNGGGATNGFFDLLNGGDLTMIGSGQNYDYSWKAPVANWLCPNSIHGAGNIDFAAAPSMVNYFGQLNENVATEVSQLYEGPCMHLVRVPPLFDTLGAIVVGWELLVEYWADWEYEYGRYWANNSWTQSAQFAWYTNRRTINQNFNDTTGVVDPEIAAAANAARRERYKKM